MTDDDVTYPVELLELNPTIKCCPDGSAVWTECVACGPDVKIDEDGCCLGCGRDATRWGTFDEKPNDMLISQCIAQANVIERLADIAGVKLGQPWPTDPLLKAAVEALQYISKNPDKQPDLIASNTLEWIENGGKDPEEDKS